MIQPLVNKSLCALFIASLIFEATYSLAAELKCSIASVDVETKSITLDMAGPIGEQYQLLFSPDLKTWSPAAETSLGTGTIEPHTLQVPFRNGFFKVVSLTNTNGWLAAETENPEYGIAFANANGDSIVAKTSRGTDGKINKLEGFAWRQANGDSYYYELDELARPKLVSAGGNLIYLEHYSDDNSTVDVSFLNQDGGATKVSSVSVPDLWLLPEGSIEDDNGVQWSDVSRGISFGINVVGCVASASVAIAGLPAGGAGALAVPLALASCCNAVVNGLAWATGDEAWKRASDAMDITSAYGLIFLKPEESLYPIASLLYSTIAEKFEEHEATKNTDLNQSRLIRIEMLSSEIGWDLVCETKYGTRFYFLYIYDDAHRHADLYEVGVVDSSKEYPFNLGFEYAASVLVGGGPPFNCSQLFMVLPENLCGC